MNPSQTTLIRMASGNPGAKVMGLPPTEVPGDTPSEEPEVTPVEAPPGKNPEIHAEPLPEGEPWTPTELPETPPEPDVSAADLGQCCP